MDTNTPSTPAEPPEHPTDVLVRALIDGARGDRAVIAAVRMLQAASWLDRFDFQRYVITDHGRTQIEWAAVHDALYYRYTVRDLYISWDERVVLRLALSLAGWEPVVLRDLTLMRSPERAAAILGALATVLPASTQDGEQ